MQIGEHRLAGVAERQVERAATLRRQSGVAQARKARLVEIDAEKRQLGVLALEMMQHAAPRAADVDEPGTFRDLGQIGSQEFVVAAIANEVFRRAGADADAGHLRIDAVVGVVPGDLGVGKAGVDDTEATGSAVADDAGAREQRAVEVGKPDVRDRAGGSAAGVATRHGWAFLGGVDWDRGAAPEFRPGAGYREKRVRAGSSPRCRGR